MSDSSCGAAVAAVMPPSRAGYRRCYRLKKQHPILSTRMKTRCELLSWPPVFYVARANLLRSLRGKHSHEMYATLRNTLLPQSSGRLRCQQPCQRVDGEGLDAPRQCFNRRHSGFVANWDQRVRGRELVVVDAWAPCQGVALVVTDLVPHGFVRSGPQLFFFPDGAVTLGDDQSHLLQALRPTAVAAASKYCLSVTNVKSSKCARSFVTAFAPPAAAHISRPRQKQPFDGHHQGRKCCWPGWTILA